MVVCVMGGPSTSNRERSRLRIGVSTTGTRGVKSSLELGPDVGNAFPFGRLYEWRTRMNRREALRAMFIVLGSTRANAAAPSVSTLIGTGSPGYSDREVNNPYGLVIGPDRALYFCDLDNQRIRRLDLKTHRTTTVAGNGQKAYRGDGGPATAASLNMPHEIQFDSAGNLYIAERDNHVVRKVDAKTGVISTFAGTGVAGILRRRRTGDTSAASSASQHCRGSQRPAAHLRYRQPPYSTGGFVQRHDRDLWRHRRTATDA